MSCILTVSWDDANTKEAGLLFFVIATVNVLAIVIFVGVSSQGNASKKEAELLSYKLRQEQLQNDLMNTSMENRLFVSK